MTPPERSNPTVTIAVACLATAMLMLDISVINTALSEIADGTPLLLDADAASLHIAPKAELLEAATNRIAARRLQQ